MNKQTIFCKELFRSMRSLQRGYSKVKSHFMKSWQISEYGGIEKLFINETAPVPTIVNPKDVLVEVKAASVNPIDLKMISGYGSEAMTGIKRLASFDRSIPEFPLTIGRDFSGVVVDRGSNASKSLKLGDEVWGTVNITRQGAFSQYILVSSKEIHHKPPSFSSTEAASIPYVASTLWSALSPILGEVRKEHLDGKKVLLLGGSGGVGSYAIQFLNGYGAEVTTTVAEDFVARAAQLGATNVIDYRQHDSSFLIGAHGKYDLIIDLVNTQDRPPLLKHLKSPSFPPPFPPTFTPRYITITFPFFSNVSKHGILLGSLRSASQLAYEVLQGMQHGSLVHWGAYAPNIKALKAVYDLVEEEKVTAVVEKVFPFSQLPQALSKMAAGHNRGKTVVDFELS